MHQDFSSSLNELLLFWKREKLALNPGISQGDLQVFEHALNFSFDEDFKRYMLQSNGLVDFEWDNNMFSFWSAKRIAQEAHDHHPPELICIADYCINLCSFGYHRHKTGIYIHYQTISGLVLVANSFTEFLKIYLANSDDLLIDVY
jgi:hypothetical protein